MAEEQQYHQEAHILCANNCGFFGSPNTLNLCSKCYRDLRLKESQSSSAISALEKVSKSTPLSFSDNNAASQATKLSPLSFDITSHATKSITLSSSEKIVSQAAKSAPLSFSRSSIAPEAAKSTPLSFSDGKVVSEEIKETPLSLSSEELSCTNKKPATFATSGDKATSSTEKEANSGELVASPVVKAAKLGVSGDATPVAAAGRCLSCRKRVGLAGFVCKCGATFCGTHRYPEMHTCQFDYKTAGRVALAKANPVIKAAKLERI